MEENGTALDIRAINEKIERESAFIDLLTMEMNKVIVGQKHMVERLLIGLLGQGHILLEGVPGLAKTLAINTLSQAVHGSFSRIQFTPDLLPADVVGTMIYNIKANEFSIKKGPISLILFLPMRLTVRLQKFNRRCLKRCRKNKLPLVIPHSN
jgi:MoxR-like ATPase